MAVYTTRYKIQFHNELNQFIETFIDAKNGAGGMYSGRAYLTQTGPFSFSFAGLGVIDAIQNGSLVRIGTGSDSGPFTIASFIYNVGTDAYTITTVQNVSAATFGFNTFTINSAGSDDVQVLTNVTDFKIKCNSDGGDLTDELITRELNIGLFLPVGSPIEFDTFLDSNHDDWRVRVEQDSVPVFHGYLVPDEGPTPFQDKPYEVTLTASDGLKLLSKQSLTKIDGSEFDSQHTLLEYVTAALYKTGLELPVRIYCNLYNANMKDRLVDAKYDMFQQAWIDYRTFMTSSTTFVDSYTALQMIFRKHFRCFYEEGKWIIERLADAQYLPDGNRYYTEYDATSNIVAYDINHEDYAKVGKQNIVRAINETQVLSANYANKSVKTNFKYQIWDEIPRNNKFERADLDVSMSPVTSIDPPATVATTKKWYTIQDWQYGKFVPGFAEPLPVTFKKAWRKSTYNAFNVEIDREIQMQVDVVPNRPMLLSKPIPVNQYDKVSVSYQSKLLNATGTGSGSYFPVFVILKTPTTFYTLVNNDMNVPNRGFWAPGASLALATILQSSDRFDTYMDVQIDSDFIPAEGELQIGFFAEASISGATDLFIKGFGLTYTPYVAGGYIPVTGDYWTRSQNKVYPDTVDEDVDISDSAVGAAKGCLVFGDNPPRIKMTTDWYRAGATEHRHYKELVNLGRYNLSYRRFWKIIGDFDGTTYAVNNTLDQHPISFMPRYGFEDLPDLRLFKLVAPLEIDYILGRFNAVFQEVYKTTADGTQEGDSSAFKYLFQ